MPRQQRALMMAMGAAVLGMAVLTGCNAQGEQKLYPVYTVPAITPQTWCPANNETEVSVDSAVWVRFSGPVDASTVDLYTIMLGTGREHIRGYVRYLPGSDTALYVPYEPLRPNTRYELYVTEEVKDIYGRALLASFEAVSFLTGDPGFVVCPPDPDDPVEGREAEEETEDEADGDDEAAQDQAGEDEPAGEDGETAGEEVS